MATLESLFLAEFDVHLGPKLIMQSPEGLVSHMCIIIDIWNINTHTLTLTLTGSYQLKCLIKSLTLLLLETTCLIRYSLCESSFILYPSSYPSYYPSY